MPMSALLFLSKRCSASRRNTENQTVSSSSGQQWDFILDGCCCPQKCWQTCLGSPLFPPTILIFKHFTFNNITTPWSSVQIFLILETSHIMFFFSFLMSLFSFAVKQKAIHELRVHCWKRGNKWGIEPLLYSFLSVPIFPSIYKVLCSLRSCITWKSPAHLWATS